MRIFYSWSGGESQRVAGELQAWLARLIPGIFGWMSDRDIQAGSPWGTKLHEQLKQTDFGILCLTPDNLTAPWVLYEAGALAMSSRVGCVVPYLLNVSPEKLPVPLAQFQSVPADKEGTWKLVRGINAARDGSMTEVGLREAYENAWPTLAGFLGVSILTELRGDVLIVTPSANHFWEEEHIRALRDKMKTLLASGHRRVIVDLSEAKRLTSAGLTFVFPGLAAAQRGEAEVALVNIRPEVRAAFEATNLIKLIQHFPTLEEALAHFTSANNP